jgi:putative polyhydroxyalkanoate system protein
LAQIVFERAHSIGLDRARSIAQRLADEMREEFRVDSDWDGDALSFQRSGLSGVLQVFEDRVRLEARLGFLLAAYKPRIEARLAENFDRYFG